MDINETLKQGIAAAEAGQNIEARTLLKAVVKADETQVAAWLWLYKVVDSLEEKEVCLENVLTLEPDNEYAKERLARIKAQQAQFFAAPLNEPAAPEPVITPFKDMPITAEYPHQDEFDDPLLCPYCLALTQADNKRCPACKQPLIVRRRVQEERTVWLWRAFFLQLVVAFFLVAFGAGYAALMGKFNGISNPVPFLPLYFGQAVDQPAQQIETILQVFPIWAFWGIIGASVYLLLLMALLITRVAYGNVLYLISATITLGLGVVLLMFYYSSWAAIGAGIAAVILGAAQIIITFNLWNDFTFKEGRLSLRLDRGVKNARSLAISGRKYSQLEMWGLAFIHLRRAAAREPANVTHHIGLITACLKVNRPDLAQEALIEAEKIPFDSPALKQLKQEVDATAVSSQ